jgi:hypothetical protein
MYDLITPDAVRLLMGFTFFPMGMLSIIAGLLRLAFVPYRAEAQQLAAHSARIGQKGITENVAAVAQSVTGLIDSVNNLSRTSSGNAIILVIVGALFVAASYWLLVGSVG